MGSANICAKNEVLLLLILRKEENKIYIYIYKTEDTIYWAGYKE